MQINSFWFRQPDFITEDSADIFHIHFLEMRRKVERCDSQKQFSAQTGVKLLVVLEEGHFTPNHSNDVNKLSDLAEVVALQ